MKMQKKWKPKHRWITSFTINLKTGRTKNEYYVPKSPEEEKKTQEEFDEKMNDTYDMIFDSIVRDRMEKQIGK